MPAGIILDVAFLYLWRVLPSRIERLWPATVEAPRKLLWAMIASTLTIWLIAALLLTLVLGSISEDNTTGIKVIGSLALIAVFLFGIFAAVLRPAPSPAGTQHVSWAMLCARGSAAGVAIFFAVLISDASETAGGIVSVFPAIFVTSMVGIWIQQGRSVSQGAVGPMCLNIVGVGLYAVVFPAAFQSTGYWAVPLSWFTGVSYSCVVYVLLHRYYNKLIADGRLQAPDADADVPMAAGGPGKLVVDASDDIHLDLPPADGDTTLPADDVAQLAKELDGWSAHDCRRLADRAAMLPVLDMIRSLRATPDGRAELDDGTAVARDVTAQDVYSALDDVHASVSAHELETFEAFRTTS